MGLVVVYTGLPVLYRIATGGGSWIHEYDPRDDEGINLLNTCIHPEDSCNKEWRLKSSIIDINHSKRREQSPLRLMGINTPAYILCENFASASREDHQKYPWRGC